MFTLCKVNNIIDCAYYERYMAKKSDSFFLRQTVNIGQTNTFNEVALDLGAYVDALGKSVMRVHNIAVSFTDSAGKGLQISTGDAASAQYQLTTQTQNDIVLSSNRSIVSSGKVYGVNLTNADDFPQVSHDMDVLPQMWTNGYLIAVDTIYLGGQASTAWTEDVYASITLECTVETMSEAAAMALALSQQGA